MKRSIQLIPAQICFALVALLLNGGIQNASAAVKWWRGCSSGATCEQSGDWTINSLKYWRGNSTTTTVDNFNDGGTEDLNFGISASGTITVRVTAANVSPRMIIFNSITGKYVISDNGTGTIQTDATPPLEIDCKDAESEISARIVGTGGIVKRESGTLVLSGINTYSGGTTFTAGRLVVKGQTGTDSGTGSGAVTVSAGSSLGGNGRVAAGGAGVVVSGGSTAVLYPGNGIGTGGTLTVGGTLNFGSGITLKFDLSSSAASGNDKIVMDGGSGKTLYCGGNAISINCGATLATSDYVLIDAGSSVISGSFNSTPTWSGTVPANSDKYSIQTVGSTVVLHYSSGVTPTKLAYTSVPSSGNVGVAFNVTVEAQDASGNAGNVSSDTTITLTESGSGNLGGTTSGIISSGQNSVTISGVTYSAADTMTLTATASGGDTLTPVTSGAITFTYSPKTLHWGAGDVNWTATDAWLDPDGNPATYSDPAHDYVVLQDTGSGTGDRTITLTTTVSPGSVTMTATKNFTISGTGGSIAGSIGLSKQGTGALTLSCENAYSGGTTLTTGQLNINNGGSSSANSAIGTGTLTIEAGTTIDNTSGGTVTLLPNNAQVWNGGSLAGFTFEGSDDLDLGTGGVTLANHRSVTVNGSKLTVGGNISGYYTLSKRGSGTLALGGNNGNRKLLIGSGGTGGTVEVSDETNLGAPTGGLVADSLFLDNGGILKTTATFTIDDTDRGVNLGNNGGGVLAPDAGTALVVAKVITGTGTTSALTKSGTGTLTLNQANTYAGGTTLSAGQLNINYGNPDNGTYSAIGTGALTIGGDGSCQIDNTSGSAVTIGVTTMPINWNADVTFVGSANLAFKNTSGAITLGGNVKVTCSGSGFLTFQGVIDDGANSYSLTKDGSGPFAPTGANTFNGGVTLKGGPLLINNASALGDGTFNIAGDGTGSCELRCSSGSDVTLNSIAQSWNADFTYTTDVVGGRNLSLGSGAVTLGNNRQVTVSTSMLTVGGVIGDSSNGYGLTKAGTGTLILSGDNSYTGNTAVNEGTLVLSGSVAGDASVASGATLKGGGTVSGGVTLSGTVAPGSSVGTLSSGAETWNDGGKYVWEINDATGTAGSAWDLLDITGNLDVQATTSPKFTIEIHSLTSGNVAGNADNFSGADTDYGWTIATASTTIDNFAAGKFTLDSSAFSNPTAGGHFEIGTSGSNLQLLFKTNRPPAAVADSVSRNQGTALKIPKATVLANDSDVDTAYGVGETITVSSVDATSANGGTVSISGNNILYVPANLNSTTPDSFSYSITDAYSHTVSGTITVNVTTTGGGAVQTIDTSGLPESVTVNFSGIPGYKYDVQRADDVAFTVNVTTLELQHVAPANGQFSHVDNDPPSPSAYYRLKYNP